jgi:hypothetical protein
VNKNKSYCFFHKNDYWIFGKYTIFGVDELASKQSELENPKKLILTSTNGPFKGLYLHVR